MGYEEASKHRTASVASDERDRATEAGYLVCMSACGADRLLRNYIVAVLALTLAAVTAGGFNDTRTHGVFGAAGLLQHIDALAQVGAVADAAGAPSGVNRGYLAPAAAGARALLLQWMGEAGMDARVDGAGNVVGRLVCAGESGRKSVVMGSHHDTVVNGGKWDGAYGVVAAIAVAHVISERERGVCGLPFDLEVVSFDDEEGNSEFGLTNTGAKAHVGADVLVGGDNVEISARRGLFVQEYRSTLLFNSSFLDNRSESEREEFVADAVRSAARKTGFANVLGYVELHIEQGPVLESAGKALGVVTAIAGQTRMTLRMKGHGGHAGTVPMRLRKDALVAASALVGAVESAASNAGDGVVGTVGVLRIEGGGGTNTIPSRVSFSLDVRAPTNAVRDAVVSEILAKGKAIASARFVDFEYTIDHSAGAVEMTKWMRSVAKEAIRSLPVSEPSGDELEAESCSRCPDTAVGMEREECVGNVSEPRSVEEVIDVLELPSGAGHDAQLLAGVVDTVMIFVRCRRGVSHSPLEAVSDEDAVAGFSALIGMFDGIAKRFQADGCMTE